MQCTSYRTVPFVQHVRTVGKWHRDTGEVSSSNTSDDFVLVKLQKKNEILLKWRPVRALGHLSSVKYGTVPDVSLGMTLA